MDATRAHHGRWATASAVAAVALALILAAAAERSRAGDLPGVEPCSKRVTTAAVRDFVSAYNRGDGERLEALFALEPDFQWFSSPRPGRRLGNAASKRKTLVRYFAARHRNGDRLHLRTFHFTGNTRTYSNFWFDLGRKARGFKRGRWYRTGGKGALTCTEDGPRIIVMSLGGPEPPRR